MSELDPGYIGSSPDSICSMGTTPYVLTGYIMEMFRQKFSNPRQIENPVLRRNAIDHGSNLYNDDQAKSKLNVVESTIWDPKTVEQRPAIIVRRNDWELNNLSPGYQTGRVDNLGDKVYTAMLIGSHTIFAVSTTGEAAEQLGHECFRTLLGFSQQVRVKANLLRFMVKRLGAIFPLSDEGTVAHAAPITVIYGANETWTVHEHVPTLNRIDVQIDYRID